MTTVRSLSSLVSVQSSNRRLVLTSDYAALLVEEFGRNPIINDEAAFDIYPPLVSFNPS